MQDAWLRYFQTNRTRESPAIGSLDELPTALRAPLVRSLSRFFLGESGEGRVAVQAARSADVALDDPMRESIALYVREEGRHAREIATALRALGAELPRGHWSEVLFRRGRRLLGLRTKMMAIAAAEVVGVVYYRMLAAEIPPLAAMANAIAADERKHLDFQAVYFERVIDAGGRPGRSVRRAVVIAGFSFVTACACATFVVDHAPLLRALGVSRGEIVRRCMAVARGAVRRRRRARAHEKAARPRRSAEGAIGAAAIG